MRIILYFRQLNMSVNIIKCKYLVTLPIAQKFVVGALGLLDLTYTTDVRLERCLGFWAELAGFVQPKLLLPTILAHGQPNMVLGWSYI